MKILHYFLGFPPYRTGGMTKYAFDLMRAQTEDGNKVTALWPGKISKMGGAPRARERKPIEGIVNYELINPLPVPLDEGIRDFNAFTKPCDASVYISFLEKVRPDVIHIHTLMGLHKEFIQAGNELSIRTVFTSHDYFGLCPKVTLYRYGKCCDDDHGCKDCIQCNVSALSLKKIQLLQSPLYRTLKDSKAVKKLRQGHRSSFFGEETLPQMPNCNVDELAGEYRKLRAYYVDMLESIDFIHFNSTVAEDVYKRYITPKNSEVVSITHKGIKKHRSANIKSTQKKVILCLAPAKPYKGFNVLKEALDQLWEEGHRSFELRVFSPVRNPSPYMIVREEGFRQEELDSIMSETDVMVAPSIWYETFGFTVLEALSYGVPVIVSDHVGAKDIVGDNGIIVKAGDIKELKEAVISPNKKVDAEIKSWRQFLDKNYEMYGEKI